MLMTGKSRAIQCKQCWI